MMKKIITVAIFLVILSFVSADTAQVGPPFPNAFYGTATVGGADVIAGAVITATIGGYDAGSFTITTAGQYGGGPNAADYGNVTKFLVDCPSAYWSVDGKCNGRAITFTPTGVSSQCGSPGTVTGSFKEGNLSRKDLAFSCPGAAAEAAVGGGLGGGGGGGGGAAEEIVITDATLINQIKQSLPAEWVNVNVNQIGSPVTTPIIFSINEIDEAIKFVTEQNAISVLQLLKSDIASGKLASMPVTVVATKYKVINADNNLFVYRTMFVITITATDYMKNVVVIDVIPKNVARNIEDMTFIDRQPKVLQADPVLQWDIGEMSQGESIQIRYTVPSLQSRVFQKTFAAGEVTEAPVEAPPEEKPPEEKPPEIPPVKPIPWVGIIIIAAIVVIGLVVYWRVSKKRA